MTFMLKDLIENPKLLEELSGRSPKKTNPNDSDHPMDECFDEYYGRISDLVERFPPGYAGIRRG